MTKLKLQVERLKVESFETAAAGEERRGTVLGAGGIVPRPPSSPCAPFETEYTGSCCDITLALSCIQTNCFAECNSLDGGICPV